MPRATNQLVIDLDRVKDDATREQLRKVQNFVNDLVAKGLDTDGDMKAKSYKNHDSVFQVDKTGKVTAKAFACYGTGGVVGSQYSDEVPAFVRTLVREGTLASNTTRTISLPETSGARILGVIGWTQTGGERTDTLTFVDGDVSVAGNTITEVAHGMTDGDEITFETDGALPGGINTGVTYYVFNSTPNTFQISVNPPSVGSAVNITSAAGGGTHRAHSGPISKMVFMGFGSFAQTDSVYMLVNATSQTAQVTLFNNDAQNDNAYRLIIFFTDDQ